MKKGFTLIELLVVITLIGILAVSVLSALNPIEQINKGRDASKRADSSQLLSSLDRYFASNEKFPWNNYLTHDDSVDVAFAGTADMVGVGVCGDTTVLATALAFESDPGGCSDNGFLVSTQELKTQFGKRPYFKSTVLPADKLYIYKAVNEPSVSICFIPASKATRDKADDSNTPLKDLSIAGGVPVSITACSGDPATMDWSDLTEACFVCIPEE